MSRLLLRTVHVSLSMNLPRKHRLLTALVALLGMLFMQLAVASYACPSLVGAHVEGASPPGQVPMQSMPGCDQRLDHRASEVRQVPRAV